MTLPNRKAKIVATLGPASTNLDMIQELVAKGVNVFRLNMSHGAHDQHANSIKLIRKVEKDCGHPLGILADLQGPKLRIGKFEDGQITLCQEQEFTLDLAPDLGNTTRVAFPHPEIFPHIMTGTDVLLNDGNLRLKVTSANEHTIKTQVLEGGILSDHKGVNLPNAELPIPALTEKDHTDLEFLKNHSIDYIGLSFVQRAEDILDLKRLLKGRTSILAKIEKPQALDNIEEIIDLSDGIMVARGDLGVELNPEQVPPIQKRLIQMAKKSGKPVVVATQMLESMVHKPTPTRAEATDVANAVYEGADAVMLSAESAAGDHPVAAVEMMAKIIDAAENDPYYVESLKSMGEKAGFDVSDSITAAARQLAETVQANVIVTYTATGVTAFRVSHKKPQATILGMTNNMDTARKLCLVWGVVPMLVHDLESLDDMRRQAIAASKELGLVQPGDKVVMTCGIPFGNPGTTNVINVEVV